MRVVELIGTVTIMELPWEIIQFLLYFYTVLYDKSNMYRLLEHVEVMPDII